MPFDTSFLIDLKDNLSPKLRKISNNVVNTEKSVARSTQKMGAGFKRLSKNIDLAGKSMRLLKVGSTAAVAGAGASVVAFSSMEKGLVNVKTLLDKNTLAKFSEDLENMQNKAVLAGFSIQDTNKALFDNISAMGMSSASINVFEQAQILAKAGVTDLGIAVDGVTSLVNAYGKETTDARFVANAFFTAQKAGKTTVEELASTIGNVASNAKMAGISLEETLATISALTTGGIATSVAVTGLKGAIAALIKPSQESEKYLKAMNIPFGAANIKAEGFTNVLKKLIEATKIYGTDALAKAIPAQEAFTAISALGEEQLALLNNTILNINKDFKDGTGMLEAYGMQIDTTADKWSKFSGAVKSVASNFGKMITSFLPLESATKKLSKFAELLSFYNQKEEAIERRKSKIKSRISDNLGNDIVNQNINTNVNTIKEAKMKIDFAFGNMPEGMKAVITTDKGNGLNVGANTITGAL
jgi:TP901 family phage tail tape measure protein